MKLALIDRNNQIIEERTMNDLEQIPADPVGKGWKWFEVEYVYPELGQFETYGKMETTINVEKRKVFHTITKVDIPAGPADVNAEREKRLNSNHKIKLEGPEGKFTVIIRLDKDYMDSLQHLAISALIRKSRGENEMTTTFRDAENNNISLTPDQAMDLFLAANLEVQDIYEAAWLIKDDPEMPTTLKEILEDHRWM